MAAFPTHEPAVDGLAVDIIAVPMLAAATWKAANQRNGAHNLAVDLDAELLRLIGAHTRSDYMASVASFLCKDPSLDRMRDRVTAGRPLSTQEVAAVIDAALVQLDRADSNLSSQFKRAAKIRNELAHSSLIVTETGVQVSKFLPPFDEKEFSLDDVAEWASIIDNVHARLIGLIIALRVQRGEDPQDILVG